MCDVAYPSVESDCAGQAAYFAIDWDSGRHELTEKVNAHLHKIANRPWLHIDTKCLTKLEISEIVWLMYDEQWINSWCDALYRNSQPKQSLFASARQNVPIEEPGQNLRSKIWEFEVWFAKSGWQNKARTLSTVNALFPQVSNFRGLCWKTRVWEHSQALRCTHIYSYSAYPWNIMICDAIQDRFAVECNRSLAIQ